MTIEQCPQSATQLSHLGKVLAFQGKKAESEIYFRKALMYDPQSSLRFADLGTVLLLQGKYREAIRYLEEAIEIDPENGIAHSSLERALKQLKPVDR